MKIKRASTDKLNAIERALKKGLPVAGVAVATILSGCEFLHPTVVGDVPRSEPQTEKPCGQPALTGTPPSSEAK